MGKQIEKDTLHELIRAATTVVSTTANIMENDTRFSDKQLFEAAAAFLKKQFAPDA